MKKLFLLMAVISLNTALLFAQTYPSGSPVDCNKQLQVKNYQLCNYQGNPIQLRGMSSHEINYYSQFFTQGSMATLVGDWNAEVVRIAMPIGSSDGTDYISNPSLATTVMNIVNLAGQYGMYAIIDWHLLAATSSSNGYTESGNPNTYVTQAKSFFQKMATQFKGQKHVMYEICNEPSACTWADITTYANTIIPAIRAIDSSAIIIVGTPNWCQNVDQAAAAPLSSYSNIMYTFHIYSATHYLGTGGSVNLGPAFQAASNKIALLSTEFGTTLSSGTGTVDTTSATKWLNAFAGSNTSGYNPGDQIVSWCNWSLSDKNETSAALVTGANINGGWSNSDLTESGLYIKNKISNPQVAATCNVPGPFTLSVTGTSGGTITVTPQLTTYPKGTIVTLIAAPASGYKFGGWTGYLTGTQDTIKATVNRDMIVKGLFVSTSSLITNGDFGNGSSNWTFGNYKSAVVPAISAADTIEDGNGHYNWLQQTPTTAGTLVPTSGAHSYQAQIIVQRPGKDDWNIQLVHGSGWTSGKHPSALNEFTIDSGSTYMLTFDAFASKPRFINVNIGEDGRNNNKYAGPSSVANYIGYSRYGLVPLTTQKTTFNLPFTMQYKSDTTCRLEFDCGFYSSKDTVWIDNVFLSQIGSGGSSGPYSLNVSNTNGGSISIVPNKTLYNTGDVVKVYATPFNGYKWKQFQGIVDDSIHNPLTVVFGNTDINVSALFVSAKNQIINGMFYRTSPTFWTYQKNCTAATTSAAGIAKGQFAVDFTNLGTTDTCVRLYQANLNLQQGYSYVVSFAAYAASARDIRTELSSTQPPYKTYSSTTTTISTTKQYYTYSFDMTDSSDVNGRLVFDLAEPVSGNASTGYVYIDSVSLSLGTLTGINEVNPQSSENLLKVFPNPVSNGLVNIDMSAIESSHPMRLNIYDMQGKLIYADIYPANSKETLNVSSFNKGIYFILLQTDQTVYKQNLIKN